MAHFIDEVIDDDMVLSSTVIDWLGGPGNMAIQGVFDHATAVLQFSVDGEDTWTDVPGSETVMSFADGDTHGDLGAFNLMPCRLRVFIEHADGEGDLIDIHIRVAPAVFSYLTEVDL
jgi:hypothetical protein